MQDSETLQLLCTFSNSNDFRKTADEIKKFYEMYNNRVFVFSNVNDPKEVYLTYNVLNMQKESPRFPNTILIHRKKQTNTLYSLNALNTLIKEKHGKLDKSYVLDWEQYSNSLVISGDEAVRIIPLKICDVLD